jgi:uncharacterized protein (DUF2141 family)
MKFAAVLLVGLAGASAAAAQSGDPAFLPIPKTLPMMLFAPDPLAGTLLRPLTGPAGHAAFAEIEPDPGVTPVAASTLAEDPSAATAVVDDPDRQTTTAAVNPAPAGDPASAPSPDVPDAVEALPAPEPPPAVEIPPPNKPETTSVTVIVENVENSSGNVNVAICDKDLSREGCPYVHEIRAQQGFVETEFKDIPPGRYAVVGYHDVNGNDTFDKMLGIPREPYALSGQAAEKMVPTFADAALPIKTGENAVIIRLKRLGG